jgi:predicted DNA-binding transcriptional regulator AlpA
MTQRELSEKTLALFPSGPAATRAAFPIADDTALINAVYVNAPQVRARYGGVSDMTLWRWLRDKELGFPKPSRINRMRYWKVSELIEWERIRQADGETM